MNITGAVKKTISYAKRNGLCAAVTAARERMQNEKEDYQYDAPSLETLEEQRKEYEAAIEKKEKFPKISILVPLYETPDAFFDDMVNSVLLQTYGNWELILADASADEHLLKRAETLCGGTLDQRIHYQHLETNGGISENTNAALEMATGDYIGLFDHDDLLTGDAICEMTRAIGENSPVLIYSDEDKFEEISSGDPEKKLRFYEPNRKPDFNPDYLLSNNYISHFSVFRADALKKAKFRKEFDGAQDFDVTLRSCKEFLNRGNLLYVEHVNKVLYHWRCHSGSTAANPESKRYAYDAGERAIADFLQFGGINAKVVGLPHLGFYRTIYGVSSELSENEAVAEAEKKTSHIFASTLEQRKDLGAIGGTLTDKHGTLIAGTYNADGSINFEGLRKGFSGGFAHRAVCQQDVDAVDLRFAAFRRELLPALTGILVEHEQISSSKSIYFEEDSKTIHAVFHGKWEAEEIRSLSILLCEEIRKAGYKILWDPNFRKQI